MGPNQLVLAVGAALLGVSQVQAGVASGRSAECFEYGYDYNGYDIQQVPFVASPAACMDECAAHRACGFWTYDPYARVCYLKSAGAFTERKPARGMVSGPRQCTFSPYCFEVGTDYFGYDIEKVEGRYIMTPMDCQRLCQGNPECAFFSWKFSTHSCFLKSSSAILNRREDPDVTSGPRNCSAGAPVPPHPSDFPTEFDPSTAPPACIESSVEYRGYNIRTSKAKSAAACQRQCQHMRECQYWTWSSQSHVCALKNGEALNGRMEGQTTLDKVSGARDCVPVLPGCQFADVGIIGARLSTRAAPAFDACQYYCASFSGCTHFSFDIISGDCTLWSSFNAYSKGSSTQGLVSGPAFCDSEEICFEQSDYVGHNVDENETGEVESPAACQSLCRNNADCHYWTWLRSNNGCYLKDANAILGRTNDATSLGRFSGPKWCTVSYGCVNINSIYTGVAFQQEEAEDYRTCGANCSSNPFCSAWTYHSDLGICSLFSGKASLAHKPVRGALSGDKNCMKETKEEENCFEEGIRYSLDNVIGVLDAKSADDCYTLCQAKTGCNWWSLRNGDQCFLLADAEKTQPAFVFDPNAISGPSSCPGDVSFSLSDKKFTGEPIATFPVYSKRGCRAKCIETATCAGWTFWKGAEHNCMLYANASMDSLTSQPGALSAPVLPPLMVSTGCTFSSVPLGSLSVNKPMECLIECQANIACAAWQSKARTLQGSATSTFVCTLFASADNPTTVRDPNTTCGTRTLPTAVYMNREWDTQSNDKVDISGTSVEECSKSCALAAGCVYWQFDYDQGCQGWSKSQENRLASGSICGQVERAVPVLLFNTSYAPLDQTPGTTKLRLASGFRKRFATKTSPQEPADFTECISKCAAEPSCTAWTFKNNACSLFSSPMVPVKDEAAISGPKSALSVPWQIAIGKKYTADPVQSWPAATRDRTPLVEDEDLESSPPDAVDLPAPVTAMECGARAGPEQCWSFKAADGEGEAECYLYNDCDDELEEEDGFVSGKATPTTSDI